MDPDPPTIAAAPAADRGAPPARRLAARAIAASVALHLIAGGVMQLVREPRAPAAPTPTIIDLDLAPVVPAAETLPPEEELARTDPPRPPTEDERIPALPPPDPDGVGVLDAGVADAAIDAGVDARVVDAARARDAGVDGGRRDAGVDAADAGDVADAGVDAGDARDAGDVPDGGLDAMAVLPVATAADAGTDDGGQVAQAGLDDGGQLAQAGDVADGGVADGGAVATSGERDSTGAPVARPSTGTAANLLTYAPAGHVVTLLARLDRLRGTEWAAQVDAMLAPLPDHDALIGDQPVHLTDVFDTLVISSPEPRNAAATTLVARSRLTPAELRDLLDQPDAHVRWSPAVGGALGRRAPSPRVIPGDPRVFLGWAPGWTTLARPADLPGLLQPAAVGLDQAAADPARLPTWLARAQTIEAEAGTDLGPALMVTAAGMFPARVDLPLADVDLPGPQRVTLTLTVDPDGFVVRGSLRYPDDRAAATAADAIVRAQRELLGSTLARLGLGTARALNAVRGLTVQRTGSRVAFSTSISTGDARVLLARVADLIAVQFARPAPPGPAAPDGGVP